MRITLEDVLAKEKKSFDKITFELFSLIIDECKRTRNKEICVSEDVFQRITAGICDLETAKKWFPKALRNIFNSEYEVELARAFDWSGRYLQGYKVLDDDDAVIISITDWFCKCIQEEGNCR